MVHQTTEEDAKALGERLARLLDASSLPADVKEGFIAMLPEMSLEQIDRLMRALEADVQKAAIASEPELVAALEKAQATYETARQTAEDTAMAGLEEVESILKQAQA